jgi:uncharacterized protein YbjT (DUF2867 family)
MRGLVAGAGGNRGRTTMPALADAGHTSVGFAFRPVETPFDFEGDLREPASVSAATVGWDAVVNIAALQGSHLAHWGVRPSGKHDRSLCFPGAAVLGVSQS